MALRDFEEVRYLPFLALRPAEMRALETLPSQTKDALLPIVSLRPWLGSNFLQKGIERMAGAYDARPLVVAIGDHEPTDSRRPVHDELDQLRLPAGGFTNWCNFIEEMQNYIPAIQFGAPHEQDAQVRRLHALGRGLFVIIERSAFRFADTIAQRVGEATDQGQDVCFVLDYGRARRDHLQVAAEVVQYFRTIRAHAPHAYLSISASSFPDGFDGLEEQDIYERQLFQQVAPQFPLRRAIYGDRGSARAELQSGGSGRPPPRIDYPLREQWRFYRSSTLTGPAGYQAEARRLLRTPGVWNPNFRVWGVQMIERTAINDASAITNPQRATAARINIHLQRQTFYDDPGAAEDTDEDWED